jgi:hypothetical protein
VSQQDGRPIVNPTGQVDVKVTLYMEKPRPVVEPPPPPPPGRPEIMAGREVGPPGAMIGRPAPREILHRSVIMPPPWEPRETSKVLPSKSLVITDDGIIPFDIDIPVGVTRVIVEVCVMYYLLYR